MVAAGIQGGISAAHLDAWKLIQSLQGRSPNIVCSPGFGYCASLTSVTIAGDLTTIVGQSTFFKCASLTNVTVFMSPTTKPEPRLAVLRV